MLSPPAGRSSGRHALTYSLYGVDHTEAVPAAQPRWLQAQATRAALVAAARRLFVAKGYHATGTEEIVAEAGVGTRERFIITSLTSKLCSSPSSRQSRKTSSARPQPATTPTTHSDSCAPAS